MALAAAHNRAACASRALQHPAAAAATARLHGWLSASAGLLLQVPWAERRQAPDPARQCAAVLAWAQLALGFVAPTALLAAAESRHYLEFQRARRQLLARHAAHGAGTAGAAVAPPSIAEGRRAAGCRAQEPAAAPGGGDCSAPASALPRAWWARLCLRLQPDDGGTARMYRFLYCLLNDPADPTLRWLLAALAAAACWEVATAWH